MRSSFPTEFDGMFLGKSREAGSFDTPDGEVKFGDAFDFSFESSDGLAQTCRIGARQLAQAADFDFDTLERFTAVHIVGDVQVSDKGGYLRPTSVSVL